MRHLLLCLLLALTAPLAAHDIIPEPACYKGAEGAFPMAGATVYTNLGDADLAFLQTYLPQTLGIKAVKKQRGAKTRKGAVSLIIDPAAPIAAEGYKLTVTPTGAVATATTPAGLFYAVQTLAQMIRNGQADCAEVADAPRFAYRGVMMDCSRHFWTKAFVLKQLDAMSHFKLNRFHFHLTDAGGWRMESKRYPKLTEQTAYRTHIGWREWWQGKDRGYCTASAPGAYGGYYTQDDLREIVRYAADRHITIIPEIEMPGHSEEVCFAYPELSCSGVPGQNGDMCVGNEQTFEFLENVLREVMDIFPSEYIHIGGDEAGRQAWKTCAKCQRRMQDEHLANVQELQSYLTARVERFLNQNGRKLLGWDEIMEGKLADNAAVMSWRGYEAGLEAAKAGHHVVMTPGFYCYFDKYQDAPHTQTRASAGGYLPLDLVYSYDPAPDETSAKYIDGVQANVWTEWIETPDYFDYMLWPRAEAIAEIGWTSKEAKPGYADFRRRAEAAEPYLVNKGVACFRLADEYGERPEAKTPVEHAARGKKVDYAEGGKYFKGYAAAGDAALTDGVRGGWNNANAPWQGFIGPQRMLATVDMGQETDLTDVRVAFMQSAGPEIYYPLDVTLSVSNDGENFTELRSEHTPFNTTPDYYIKEFQWKADAAAPVKARYVRIHARQGEKGGWVFTDEIVINERK